MNLKHLTDEVLLNDTKVLVKKEREAIVKVIHHLKEIDQRKLFVELNYQSLFDYCVKELGYSEASAHRRIIAARLLNDIPNIDKRIESGKLTLINLANAVRFMKQNQIKDVREKARILSQIENLSKSQCDQKLFEITGKERPKTTTITILDETFVQLQNVRDLLGGVWSNDELLQKMITDEIQKIEKEKFKISSKGSLSPVEVKRVIPANLKKKVYLRDDKKCVKCGSKHNLNYDHRKPFALGGKTNEQNIRLLCFNCNQRSRINARL